MFLRYLGSISTSCPVIGSKRRNMGEQEKVSSLFLGQDLCFWPNHTPGSLLSPLWVAVLTVSRAEALAFWAFSGDACPQPLPGHGRAMEVGWAQRSVRRICRDSDWSRASEWCCSAAELWDRMFELWLWMCHRGMPIYRIHRLPCLTVDKTSVLGTTLSRCAAPSAWQGEPSLQVGAKIPFSQTQTALSLAHISGVSRLWGCLSGPHIWLSRWRRFFTIFLINPLFPGGCTSSHSLEFSNAFTNYHHLFPSELRAEKVKCTFSS